MRFEQFLSVLKEKRILISQNNGKLVIDAPEGALDEVTISKLREFKSEILEMITEKTVKKKIEKTKLSSNYSLSSSQKRLWILDQLEDESIAYNIPAAFYFEGDFNKIAFQKAYSYVIQRHESLRTNFIIEGGEPKQIISESIRDNITITDLRTFNDRDKLVKQIAEEEFTKSFNLESDSLIRLNILRLEDYRFLLLFNMHHVISDGWSMNVLVRDFIAAYNSYRSNKEPLLEPLRIQYKDYSAWQNELYKNSEIENQREYWVNKLSGELPLLNLPTDKTRPAKQSFNGERHNFVISKELNMEIKKLCRDRGVSLFMLLHALIKTLFFKYTESEDIILGSPVAGRRDKELKDQIGFYVNTIALRDTIQKDMLFTYFLDKVKESCTEAFDNQDYPFDKLIEDLDIKRDLSRSPIFDVMLVVQNNERTDLKFDDLEVVPFEVESRVSKFDMTFEFTEVKEEISCSIEYNCDIYNRNRIKSMSKHLITLINSIISNTDSKIEDLNILPDTEKNILLNLFNDTKEDYSFDKTIIELFEKQVEKTPDNTAVIFENTTLTYRELNEKANIVGNYLRSTYNIKADDLIGLIAERSEKMIISLLGILKSGAAYVPIDPSYPKGRIDFIIEDSSPKAIICDNGKRDQYVNIEDILNSGFPADNPDKITTSSDLAYVIYTSGSTGKPKGTLIENHSVLNTLEWMQKQYKITSGDVILQQTTFTFDVSVWELFWWSLYGAKVCFLKQGLEKEPEAISKAILNERISIIHFVPSMYNQFLEYLNSLKNKVSFPSLRQIFCSGEELTIKDLKASKSLLESGVKLSDIYGPTEATIYASYYDCHIDDSLIPIGKPISNTTLYILNNNSEIQPIGIPGELCISGPGLARGYLNRPDLTSEKFINNPFNTNEKMYKTGDLARWFPDGNIEYLGRIDNQVKIRGYRIEIGEIEQVLEEHNNIITAVVVTGQNEKDDRFLAAYYTGTKELEISKLRSYLGNSLPDYMIPSYFVYMETMPLTSSGKVNRKALPKIDGSYSSGVEYVAPRNDIERSLLVIWKDVLSVDKIGIKDNFFDLGGHSLKATVVISKVLKELNKNITLKDIFTYPTVETLSEVIEKSTRSIYRDIEKIKDNKNYDLSNNQRRLWLFEQLEEDSIINNIPIAFYLEGDFNYEVFQRAYTFIIQRHESLRTNFIINNGEPKQIVSEFVNDKIIITDLRTFDDRDKRAKIIVKEEFNKSFNLESDALIRFNILRLEDCKFLLLFNMHHIISDGWSINILVKDFLESYNSLRLGKEPLLEPLRIQYKDYSGWQNKLLNSPEIETQKEYWKEKLGGALPLLDLPSDSIRPSIQSFNGDKFDFIIDKKLSLEVKTLCNKENVSLFMVLNALVKTLFYKYTGSEDIILGSPVAGRRHDDLKDQVGMYINTIALRDQLHENISFTDFLVQVKDTCTEAIDNQDYPFDKIIEDLNIIRDISRSPVFDIMLVVQNNEMTELKFDRLDVQPYEIENSVSKYDMSLEFTENGEEIYCSIEYNIDIFNKKRIEAMSEHLLTLTSSIIDQPQSRLKDLNILSEKEKDILLNQFNESETNCSLSKTIVELFEEQVKKTPDNTALTFENTNLSYSELNEKANLVGHYLRDNYYIKPDDFIGLLFNRSEKMLIALLGILKSGAAYVPIDPEYPQERIDYIVKDTKVRVVLDEYLFEEILKCSEKTNNPKKIAKPNNLAYIIYTSGSTGQPKGVLLEHRNIVNLIESQLKYFNIGRDEKILLFSNICFDASVEQIWLALLSGSNLIVISKNSLLSSKEFNECINTNNITHLDTVPSYLFQIEIEKLNNLKRIVLGGEKCPINILGLLNNKIDLFNLYGPTETTVTSVRYQISKSDENLDSIPIGRPVTNTQVYILDKNSNLAPVNFPGELCISGEGVARGYLNRDELTSEKFVDNPFIPGTKMYKTGDLAKWLPDGNIEFLGRIDNQVKIRGYRIETGEIESRLLKFNGIMSVAVIAVENPDKGNYLAAYYVADKEYKVSELRNFIGETLPGYMIPAFFINIESLPLNSNGKIDVKALPKPDDSYLSGVEYVVPENDIEFTLADIWQEVLGISQIGTLDNFFELGGNSISSIAIVSQIGKKLDIQVNLKTLFNYPTIKSLALFISNNKFSKNPLPELICDKDSRFEPFPLTDVQQAYWIGRQDSFDLGGVGTHSYSEFILDDIDIDKLNKCLNYLIQRHDMLRMVITKSGQQQILQDVGEYSINVLDMRGLSEDEERTAFYSLRNELSHKVYSGEEWPLFDFRATIFRDGVFKLHYSMDGLLMDGASDIIFFNEFIDLYTNNVELPELNVTFRDYVITEQKIKDSVLYKASSDYWSQKIPYLPQGPELTLYKKPSEIVNPIFKRKCLYLDNSTWESLRSKIKSENITPTIFFIEMFGLVINRWSKNNSFLLNLTLFNRMPLHEDIDKIIGDFTSLTLLEIDFSTSKSISEYLHQTQNQLLDDLEHKYFSGVEVQREISRLTGSTVTIPVVVTSTLGMNNNFEIDSSLSVEEVDLSDIQDDFSITQTSQVWIDFKIFDHQNSVGINWDYVDGLFPSGMIDNMFEAFSKLIFHYAEDNSDWNKPAIDFISKKELESRFEANKTTCNVSDKYMYELFVDNAIKNSDKTAIKTTSQTLSYRELYSYSITLGRDLENAEAKPNELIAILMHKGWEQVVATLGIQFSGAAYMPIDASLPIERINKLIEIGDVTKVVSVSSVLEGLTLEKEVELFCVDKLNVLEINTEEITFTPKQTIEDLAYVIFTSGSTGEPKGVMIDHRGAVNTILDINNRFNITDKDSCFALSSLSFDLSVYDIFGLLAAGGTVVIPEADEGKDPAAWLKYLKEDGVTVWNSVPALMQMFTEYLGESETDLGLEKVLLSGDWIPVSLPDQIKAINPKANVVSLGGATEASIWSICYPIDSVDPNWKSIPYGKPLLNQSFHVLKKDLTHCPEWVAGDLYIGGIGLALGYWKDEEKTDFSFIIHPETGEKLYRTGDQGRYLPDGNIEFLGREDHQVKIQGYRIELGEVEEVINSYPMIETSVVDARSIGGNQEKQVNKQLVAYVQPKEIDKNSIGDLAIAGNTITDKDERIAFKFEHKSIRNLDSLSIQLTRSLNDLKSLDIDSLNYTYDKLTFETFSKLFDCLECIDAEGIPLYKYYYPSAGSLYPVQIYIQIEDDNIEGIEKGYYYLNPFEKKLYQTGLLECNNKESNNGLFKLYLIGDMDSIEPLYGKFSEEFCYSEAGYITQLLLEYFNSSVTLDTISCCKSLTSHFKLNNNHKIIKAFSCNISQNNSSEIQTALTESKQLSLNIYERKSYRSFSNKLIKFTDFTSLLTSIDNYSIYDPDNKESLEIYVSVKNNRVEGLNGGLYKFDKKEISLHKKLDEKEYFKFLTGSEMIYLESGFGIYIVGEQNKNTIFTAGSIGQSLMNISTKGNIGLCTIGIVDQDEAGNLLSLGLDKQVIHTFLGGYVTQEQITTSSALDTPKDYEAELKKYIGTKLPGYMVPTHMVMIEKIPLTSNGKVDRKSLPDPSNIDLLKSYVFVKPETETEQYIAQIWKEVLGIDKPIGLLDNFFEIGGNSIYAVTTVSKIEAHFEINIGFKEIFEYSILKDLAVFIDNKKKEKINELSDILSEFNIKV